MCGIVGGVAGRDVTPILLEGLRRLEYRGYDSAGVALLSNTLERRRAVGKINQLDAVIQSKPISGHLGIAHTRWATHGVPTVNNAHPHFSGSVAVVHNGIIENYSEIKTSLQAKGYQFDSDTDTEVIAHFITDTMKTEPDFINATRAVIGQLDGAYSLGVIHKDYPDILISARKGSPLCIGLGIQENFIASDVMALLPVTSRFIFLEDGDFAVIKRESITIEDEHGNGVARKEKVSELSADAVSMGEYSHYMEKEIHEQATVIEDTVRGKIKNDHFDVSILGDKAEDLFKQVEAVHIVSCGTSYHAGSVARYWIERYANIPCHVEVASEYRYRHFVVPKNTLFISISQSGETADTLSALAHAKQRGYLGFLGICNAPESSLTRESDFVFLTAAGPEKSVASTKAFTTQLAALMLITDALAEINTGCEGIDLSVLNQLSTLIPQTFANEEGITQMAQAIHNKNHALFLGRGSLYPVAMEGALKLKEITYIHAEAYPAGELKHGPLALVDDDMPVIAVAPDNDLLEKLKSNLQEVKARGGKLYVFADEKTHFEEEEGIQVVKMPSCPSVLAPMLYTIPLQLLSYHTALLLGTDVDQPRNLAKSVTVE